jgi:hypothetical protein
MHLSIWRHYIINELQAEANAVDALVSDAVQWLPVLISVWEVASLTLSLRDMGCSHWAVS